MLRVLFGSIFQILKWFMRNRISLNALIEKEQNLVTLHTHYDGKTSGSVLETRLLFTEF